MNWKQRLDRGAQAVINHVVRPLKNETCLIFACDDQSLTVARSLYLAVKKYTRHVSVIFHPVKAIAEAAEPVILSALKSQPDIFIITNLYYDGCNAYQSARYGWYPNYLKFARKSRGYFFEVNNLSQFSFALNTDYLQVKKVSQKIGQALNSAFYIKIKDRLGTDLIIDISDKSRRAKADCDGSQNQPGSGLNFPVGEVLITPIIGKTKGIAYIDLEFYDEPKRQTNVVDKPIKLLFKNGFVSKICGGRSAKRLNQIVQSFRYQYRPAVSEFAFGVNEKITKRNNKPVGDILIDEKIYGTCHIALGESYENDPAPYHIDLIFSQPEVYLGDKNMSFSLVCRNNKILL